MFEPKPNPMAKPNPSCSSGMCNSMNPTANMSEEEIKKLYTRDMEMDLVETFAVIEQNETNYETRYKLVLQAMYIASCLGYQTGIRVDSELSDEKILWWVSWIMLPNDIGEISWHNPSQVTTWSGYNTDEKYLRCNNYQNYVADKYGLFQDQNQNPENY